MGKIDRELWTPFIKQWEEAESAGLTIHEASELLGINVHTMAGRQFVLRKRGVMLPLLRGQRGPRGGRQIRKKTVHLAVPKPGFDPVVIYVV